MAIFYLLIEDRAGGNIAVYLTILASAASVLAGLVVRLVLCCVLGVGDDRGGGGGGGGASDEDGDDLDMVYGAELDDVVPRGGN